MRKRIKRSERKPNIHTPATAADSLMTTAGRGSQAIEKSLAPKGLSQAAEEKWATWLKSTFGTEDQALQHRLLYQAVSTVSDFAGQELKSFDHTAAAIGGIGPKDALEGMLAVQMVAVHSLAMECMGRAALKEQPDIGVELNLNRAMRLMRTFASQTESLGRHRGKGGQKMTVEHVHVYQGGQAIVGQVTQKNTKLPSKKTGGADEHE